MGENALDQVRHSVGQLTYVTYGSRPDVVAAVGELASCVTRYTNAYVGTLNTLISELRTNSNEAKLIFRSKWG